MPLTKHITGWPVPAFLAFAALAALAVVLAAFVLPAPGAAAPGAAVARPAVSVADARPAQLRWPVSGSLPPRSEPALPKKHLIVIPGGGFTFHDQGFWPAIAAKAGAAGFVPHFLDYRLFDLEGAVADAREMARRLAARYGRDNVYAYGSSAGGTLATLLAASADVAGAVASSGLYDLRHWPWATLYRGPDYLNSIGATWEARRRVSPMRHRLRCPALLLHGSWDPIVAVTQALDYAAWHPKARLRIFPGGHGLYRTRPASVTAGMRWLTRTATKQAKAVQRRARGARTANAARRILCA